MTLGGRRTFKYIYRVQPEQIIRLRLEPQPNGNFGKTINSFLPLYLRLHHTKPFFVTKKEIAQNFLTLASKGEAQKAFQLYVGHNFIHHNAYFKGDQHTLIAAMEQDAKNNPGKIFEIQRALEDAELVAVHSRIQQSPNDEEFAVIHILRFDMDKIVEIWDIGQVVPANMVNENGMF